MPEVARNLIATRRHSLHTLRVSRFGFLAGSCIDSLNSYVRWHNYAHPEERQNGTQKNSQAIGLQNNEATVRWLYDHHFAAVAGDTVAFEAWPPPMETGMKLVKRDIARDSWLTWIFYSTGWCLHEWLLTEWGTPIGEMWDLETLSKVCEKEGRWTFFLTSAPLHVKGGVGMFE